MKGNEWSRTTINGFADRCLTAWLRYHKARNWNRTNNLLITNELLYQLSYTRINHKADNENRTRTNSLEDYNSTIKLCPH